MLAVKDKGSIFQVKLAHDGKTLKDSSDKNSKSDVLGFFTEQLKTSYIHFKASSTVAARKKSPVSIANKYRVTIRYTLSAVVETVSQIAFMGTKVRSQTLSNTIEKSFVVGPGKGSETVELDFGKYSVAGSSRSAFGAAEGSLKGEPKLIAEIIGVEMVND